MWGSIARWRIQHLRFSMLADMATRPHTRALKKCGVSQPGAGCHSSSPEREALWTGGKSVRKEGSACCRDRMLFTFICERLRRLAP